MTSRRRPAIGQLSLPLRSDPKGSNDSLDRFLPVDIPQPAQPVPTVVWEIPHTISDLAYLTHNYYRYFGKFPSVIPRRLLRDYEPAPDEYVLDHFAGCGTTLVEAKLRGVNAVGIDLNPLGVLAGRVKSRAYDLKKLAAKWAQMNERLASAFEASGASDEYVHLTDLGRSIGADWIPRTAGLSKWYAEETLLELGALKGCILDLPKDDEREFLTLAFLAINRRTSYAYDGEVRPHVNPKKRPRPVLDAFAKKFREMYERMVQFAPLANNGAQVSAYCMDARCVGEMATNLTGRLGLVITHPPYLNCFDYFPVYRLELIWSEGFEEVWDGFTMDSLRRSEIRSWPATSRALFDDYFRGLRDAFEPIRKIMKRGGRCCVVIGDCTIHRRLVPVHTIFVDLMEGLGFRLEKVIYRTTHYGIGKYAYMSRADYHGAEAEKRDAVLVFLNH